MTRQGFRIALHLALLLAAGPLAAVPAAEATGPSSHAARLAQWRAARFGMFIHWGPVSIKGTEIGWSRGAKFPSKNTTTFTSISIPSSSTRMPGSGRPKRQE